MRKRHHSIPYQMGEEGRRSIATSRDLPAPSGLLQLAGRVVAGGVSSGLVPQNTRSAGLSPPHMFPQEPLAHLDMCQNPEMAQAKINPLFMRTRCVRLPTHRLESCQNQKQTHSAKDLVPILEPGNMKSTQASAFHNHLDSLQTRHQHLRQTYVAFQAH